MTLIPAIISLIKVILLSVHSAIRFLFTLLKLRNTISRVTIGLPESFESMTKQRLNSDYDN